METDTPKDLTLIELKPINQLKNWDRNPREIDEKQFAALCKYITRWGLLSPLLVDNRDKQTVLGGNMRLKACIALGIEEVEIKYVEVNTDDEALEVALLDNNQFGSYVESQLVDLIKGSTNIQLEDFTLAKVETTMADLLANNEIIIDQVVEVEADEAEGIATDIVVGDLIEIGEHRLLCGDSTDSDAVAKLMNGEKADMVFTDPPYGIKVVKSKMVGADFGIAKKGKYSEVIADDTTKTAQEFYQTCISLGFEKFIIWGGNYFTDFLPFSDSWLIWNKRANTNIKNTFADGEMAYCSFHTPIRIYDQLWNGMIREGEKEKRVHPTQKPIRMLSEIIEDHIKGNLIYDGFLGSGSIMVAAHQLKRKCYGMELDPKYCQVIINRMRKLVPNIKIKINGK